MPPGDTPGADVTGMEETWTSTSTEILIETQTSTAGNTLIKCRPGVRAARAHGSTTPNTGKELPTGTKTPVNALASLPTGPPKLSATPGDMEVKELTADLTGEGVVPGRVWDRVALATAREEETGVPLEGPGETGVVNGWRVSGGVRAAAVMVAVPVAAVAEAVAVAEVVGEEAAGNDAISGDQET